MAAEKDTESQGLICFRQGLAAQETKEALEGRGCLISFIPSRAYSRHSTEVFLNNGWDGWVHL